MDKKISFGFSKTAKKTEKVPSKKPEVEFIECIDKQAIKVKNAIKAEIKQPLVIPMNSTKKSLIDRAKEAAEKNAMKEKTANKIPSIDELAVRELINDAKGRDAAKNAPKVTTLPQSKNTFVGDGEEEPSLDDYENVPISDYGMAMLRGMGWKEGMPIGKNASRASVSTVPELRAKGLGLGADKLIKPEKPSVDENGKELMLVKGAFAKIVAGSHKGTYCQVQGLNDEHCRVIVKTAVSNNVLSVNEFLIKPITKEEYALGSKVINNAKYEEFKEKAARRLKEGNLYRNQSMSRAAPSMSSHPNPKPVKSNESAKMSGTGAGKKKSKRDRSRSRSREPGHKPKKSKTNKNRSKHP